MKKVLLFFLFLGFAQLNSQNLILTQAAYEPAVGDSSFYNVMDTSAVIGGLPNQVSGMGCNWNFMDLIATPLKANATYTNPGSVPEATAYPTCNLVQKQGSLRNYYKSVSTPGPQTEMLGITSSSINLTFTNSAIIAKFPISYGTNFSDNIGGSFVFSVSGNFSGTVSSSADGTGTLWLPGGVALNNVLRVKSVQTINLLLGILPFGTAKQIVYNYFHSSQKFPVLNITYSSVLLLGSSTPSTSAVITGNSKSIYTGIEDVDFDSNSLSIYPNPVNDLLFVQLDPAFKFNQIECLDARGQNVLGLKSCKNSENVFTLDFSACLPGLYFLKLSGPAGTVYKKILVDP